MTETHDIDVLESVLGKVETLVAGVRPDQLDRPTECPRFDVRQLVDHIVGFMGSFAAAAQGRKADVDPTGVHSGDPVKDVRLASEQMVAGWRELGTDRLVSVMGPESPAAMVLGMSIIEYVAHGSDLARATGQPLPFSDDEASVALSHAEATLTDDFRGEGKLFGLRVPVPADAPVLQRFLAFMGRPAS